MNLDIMSNADLEAELIRNESERNTIYKETVEPSEKKMVSLYNRNQKIRDVIALRKINSTSKGNPDWDFTLYHHHDISQEQLRYQQDALFNLGLGSFGFYADIKQVALSISFGYKTQTIEKVEKGIETVLPHMKWRDAEPNTLNGKVKSFHVIDKDCSLNNSWYLFYNKDKKWVLKDCRGSYGRVKHFKDLHEALVYIKEELSDKFTFGGGDSD